MKINFYKDAKDHLLRFAVIVAKSFGKWVFCKHKERDTYEIPGGHRESGESILQTAKRELYEETGAIKYDIKPLCTYCVEADDGTETFGMLYYADITDFEAELHSEIEKVMLFDALPRDNWTYPLLQPAMVEEFLKIKQESQVAVKALVKNDEKILLLVKSENEARGDVGSSEFDLPGGRMTQEEILITAIEREIREETALEAYDFKEIARNVIEKDGKKLKFVYFECFSKCKEVKLSLEHDGYYWKSAEEILNDASVPEWIKLLLSQK